MGYSSWGHKESDLMEGICTTCMNVRLTLASELMDMSLSKLLEMARTGKPGMLQSMGSQRVGHD